MSFNIILISLESSYSVHIANAILLIPTTETNYQLCQLMNSSTNFNLCSYKVYKLYIS